MSEEELKQTEDGDVYADNCLSNGEQGREEHRVHKNADDSLNFGWFSLPRDGQNHGGPRQGSRPASAASGRKQQGGRPDSRCGAGPSQYNYRPPSGDRGAPNQGGRNIPHLHAPPGGHGGSATYLPPPSRQGHCQQEPGYTSRADSQRLVVGEDPDRADFERQDHSQRQTYPPVDQRRGQGDDPRDQGIRPEIDAVDWPLSRAAQEMLMRQAPPPAEPGYGFLDKQGMSSRPGSRGGTPPGRQIPPTPVPPLHWNGYRGSNRPTFATWRERWHRDHSHPNQDYDTQYHQGEMNYQNNMQDFNSNNITFDCDTICSDDIRPATNLNSSGNDTNNNSDNDFVTTKGIVDLRYNQGGYWGESWSDNHITHIGTDFIGYDGSIFKPIRGPEKSTTLTQFAFKEDTDEYHDANSCPTDAGLHIPHDRYEMSLACHKRLKKYTAAVDPNVQPSDNALNNVMCDNMDIQEEGPPAHIKPIHKKTSFTISFRSRMKSLKQAASCWGKKIRGTSLPRNAYCHFENDL